MANLIRAAFRSNEIISALLPYLSVLDYINLRRSIPLRSGLISSKELLFRRFSQRIRTDLCLPEEVAVALETLLRDRHDVYLTGGFLIAIMRGDPIVVGQDVDIFHSDDQLYESFPRDPKLPLVDMDNSGYDSLAGLMVILTNMYGAAKIQFIQHHSSEPLENITHFDIPICRNAFNLTLGLHIFDLSGLTEQKCSVNLVEWISNFKDLTRCCGLKPLYQRLVDRIDRYYRRGFEIGVITGGDEKTIRALFKCDIDNVPFIKERSQILRLVGKHNPDSCIYTEDCKCANSDYKCREVRDPRHGMVFRCECDHHMVFYRELKMAWLQDHVDKLWKEYEAFWSPEKLKKTKH